MARLSDSERLIWAWRARAEAAERLAEQRGEALRELYEYTQELQRQTLGLLMARGLAFPPVDPTLTERIDAALADGGQQKGPA